MKSASIVLALLFCAYAAADIVDTYLEPTKEVHLACGKELGISGQTAREIYDADSKSGIEGATCYRACMLKKLGMMTDSKILEDKIHDFLKTMHAGNPEMIQTTQKATSKCIEKVKSIPDDCKMAYSYIDCYLGNI